MPTSQSLARAPLATREPLSAPARVPAKASWVRRIVENYKEDHTHPVNSALHLGVGWPLVGASLFVLPFAPLWAAGLFLGGYAAMFTGHFLFERNLPTILKHPTTPFAMAWAIVRGLGREGVGFLRQFGIRESAERGKLRESGRTSRTR